MVSSIDSKVVKRAEFYARLIPGLQALEDSTDLKALGQEFLAILKDAKRFRFLQNLPPVKAQQYFWNHASRKQRAEVIDADMRSVIENIQERK